MFAMTFTDATAPLSRPSTSKKIPPARAPRTFLSERMLQIDPRAGTFRDATIRDLPDFLRPNDVVVVNDAATLPASLPARTRDERSIELRLLAERAPSVWAAALLGEGDWRTPTEHRPAPPRVQIGDELRVGAHMIARVIELGPHSPREVIVRFDREDDALWSELYAVGRLIQYAHVPDPLPLYEMQSVYASRPWAVEMPSAGRPLKWEILDALRRKGIVLRTLTHAAGLSSTGDDAIDRALPLVERYEIPRTTIDALGAARAKNARVLAVGTSVVRALEGSAARHGGRPVAEAASTDLRIDENFRPIVVDGLLTGIHDDPATSHHSLLRAFAPARLLERAHAHAAAAGYVGHELGDSTLILSA